MKKNAICATFLALLASSAFADNERGLYLGAGVGQFNVEVDDVDELTSTIESFDADDTTFKVFAGWRFAPFIAVELDYIDLGNPEDTVSGVRVSADINGVAPYVVGTLPVGPIELFARVGHYFYDVKIDGQSLGARDDSNEDLVYLDVDDANAPVALRGVALLTLRPGGAGLPGVRIVSAGRVGDALTPIRKWSAVEHGEVNEGEGGERIGWRQRFEISATSESESSA